MSRFNIYLQKTMKSKNQTQEIQNIEIHILSVISTRENRDDMQSLLFGFKKFSLHL